MSPRTSPRAVEHTARIMLASFLLTFLVARILVLLIILLVMNTAAILIRNRFQRKW